MYPPVAIGTARVCMNKDTVIGGQLHLPAGTCVNLSHHSLQNTSYNWDSPEKFTPGEEFFFSSSLQKPAAHLCGIILLGEKRTDVSSRGSNR